MIQIFSADGRTGRDQPKVVQEVLADLKNGSWKISMLKIVVCSPGESEFRSHWGSSQQGRCWAPTYTIYHFIFHTLFFKYLPAGWWWFEIGSSCRSEGPPGPQNITRSTSTLLSHQQCLNQPAASLLFPYQQSNNQELPEKVRRRCRQCKPSAIARPHPGSDWQC